MRAIALVAIVVAAACGSASSVTLRGASPTAGPTQQAAAVRPAATGGGVRTFVDADMGFKVDLADPWRPSSCNQPSRTDGGIYSGRADFVVVDEMHEIGTDVGRQYASVAVTVTGNKEGLTARRWIEVGRIGTPAGTVLQDVQFLGRPGVQLVPSGTYFFADGGRMWSIGADLRVDPALKTAADALIASFRLLGDDEIAAARGAASPTPAPRPLDALVAGLAAGFAAKDADALAALMSDCFGNALEKAGASFVTRAREVADLRAGFAAGLTVAVATRPVKGDPSLGGAMIGSTWSGDGQPARSIDLSLRDDGGRWRWVATVRLQR